MRSLAHLASQLAFAAAVVAQELPVEWLSVQQGLPHARVTCCYRAASGHLWIGTWEGLSRFDGHRFVSFDRRDGLPNALVDVVRDVGDDVWIGTHGAGVLRLRGAADAVDLGHLRTFSIGSDRTHGIVLDLLVDSRGRLWASSETSVAMSPDPRAADPVFTTVADHIAPGGGMLFELAPGIVAAACSDGVRVADERGSAMPFVARFATIADCVGACALGGGVFWIVRADAVFALRGSGPGASLERIAAAPPGTRITACARARDGGCWLGTTAGLFHQTAASEASASLAPAMPLHTQWIESLHADPEGDLWVGLHTQGLARVWPAPVVNWTAVGGLDGATTHLVEESTGRMLVTTESHGFYAIDGDRLAPLPGLQEAPFANVGMRCVCDRDGHLWVGTDAGMYWHPGPTLDRAGLRVLGPADGVPAGTVFSLRATDDNGVWCSTDDRMLLCLAVDGGRVAVRERHDLRASPMPAPRAIWRAADGALWLAPYFGLWRLRGDALEAIAPNGIPDPAVNARCLVGDGRGGLWIGLRTQGLVHCADPGAAAPVFAVVPAGRDAPSMAFWEATRHPDGSTWFATGRGLWQLDAARTAARTFASAEGLPSDAATCCVCDRRGRIWAGTFTGASRLDVSLQAPPRAPPRAQFGQVFAAGQRLARGVDGSVAPFELDASGANVAVELAAVDFRSRPPRCRYRFAGGEWSPPMLQSVLGLEQLAPGSYRLEVEAIGCDGTVSPAPVALAFTVLPPLWRRGWMLALYGASVASIAYALHRVRLQRALALERVRLRIAADLHDDLGAGLAQIAILSEVGRQRATEGGSATLGEVAGIARDLRAGMADLVWTIDPAHDRLDDLVRRLRQVANNLFDAGSVELTFRAPDDAELRRVSLPAESRRHWLLFGKEALTNAARHARANRVEVVIELAGAELALTIRDDGAGFATAAARAGNGLASLRARADALGLVLTIDSAPGAGTRIRLGPA